MSNNYYDHFAAGSYLHEPDNIQKQVIDYLVGNSSSLQNFAWLSAIKDPVAKVELLALAQLTSIKNYAQSGENRAKRGGIRDALSKLKSSFQERAETTLKMLNLLPTLPCLHRLPAWSFAIHMSFTLCQPYTSKDEAPFYLLENPVRKEKVFRLPYIAPTQWKGVLRSVMVRQLAAELGGKDESLINEKDLQSYISRRTKLFMLFGSEKGLFSENEEENTELYLDKLLPEKCHDYREKIKFILNREEQNQEKKSFAGRLHFYPSFFTQIALEVMNPHSRKTGAGNVPILFECVPKGAKADFLLLYIPYDLIGMPSKELGKEVVEDLDLVVKGLHDMFCLYGFGAKTTSGFGRAYEKIDGALSIRSKDEAVIATLPANNNQTPQTPLPKYLEAPGCLKKEYLNSDGSFKERSAAELQKMGKSARWEYEKAKRWWLSEKPKEVFETVIETKEKTLWPTAEFKSFDKLVSFTQSIKEKIS